MTPGPAAAWRDLAWYEVAAFQPTAGEADPYREWAQFTSFADARREVWRLRGLGYRDVHVRKVTIGRIRSAEGPPNG